MSQESIEPRIPMPEAKRQLQLETVCVAPNGLGFGEGKISFQSRLAEGVSQSELTNRVEPLFYSPELLNTVDIDDETGQPVDDDGCGDGRGVTDESGELVSVIKGSRILKRSLNRPKVFGGGATMGVAATVANGEAGERPMQALFTDVMQNFDELGINYGAHTDQHAEGEASGCGAIDNALVIFHNSVKYRQEIAATLQVLDPSFETEMIEAVLDNFGQYNQSLVDRNEQYSGRQVMDQIHERQKVIKKLAAGHREMYIILNDIDGRTVNQHAVRDSTREAVQVFAVDLWRVRDIAARMKPEDSAAQQKAIIGELVYTLATAATLTAGDLPVYHISERR